MQGKAASSAGMRRAREARPLRCLPAATARRDSRMAARSVTVADRAGGALPADVCSHTVAHRSWCPDTWPLSPPDEDQNTCDRRLPLDWRRCIHAATDTVVRRPHRRPPRAPLTRSAMVHRQARGRAALPANHARRERDYPHAKQEGEIGGGSALYIYNNWSMQWGIHAGSPPS